MARCVFLAILLIFLTFSLEAPPPVHAADAWDDCASNDTERRIRGCTRVLARKKMERADRAAAYYNRAMSYLDKEEYDRALADIDEAIAFNSKDADSYNLRGQAHFGKKEFHVAIKDFDKAIALNKKDLTFFFNRGLSLIETGDLNRAIADFNAALKLDPKDVDSLNERGRVYLEMSDNDRAIAEFDKALAIKPDNPAPVYNRGLAYYREGNYKAALRDFDHAVRLDPKDGESHLQRSAALSSLRKLDEAYAAAQKAVELLPGESDAYNMRCWTLALKKQFNAALKDCDRAVELSASSFAARHSRGVVYRELKRYDEALRDFNKAIEEDPSQLLNFADRGKTFEAMGVRGKALADYKTALNLEARDDEDREARNDVVNRIAALALSSPTVTSDPKSETIAAAEPAPSGRRIALVIGNARYQNTTALNNPANDARIVASALRNLGFSEVIEKHDLTLGALSRELKAFGDKSANADWALVYYAGHGIEVGGTNYVIPIDAALKSASHVEEEAIPLRRVLSKVEQARKLRLVILDACRDNPFARTMKVASATRSVGRGLARIEPAAGVLVAYAARDGQVAKDGDGVNSPYAEALVRQLQQPGLEISLLFRRIRDSVWQKTNGEQEPFTYGSLPAEALYFRTSKR